MDTQGDREIAISSTDPSCAPRSDGNPLQVSDDLLRVGNWIRIISVDEFTDSIGTIIDIYEDNHPFPIRASILYQAKFVDTHFEPGEVQIVSLTDEEKSEWLLKKLLR